MQLISKFNKGFRYLICAIYIFSKYTWVIPLKDKKGITVTNAFQKILKECNHREAKSKGSRPNKIWVHKDKEFYNRSMNSWLEKNAIEMYFTHNKGKPVVAERFIRTLKNNIYKYLISVSKNAYIDN